MERGRRGSIYSARWCFCSLFWFSETRKSKKRYCVAAFSLFCFLLPFLNFENLNLLRITRTYTFSTNRRLKSGVGRRGKDDVLEFSLRSPSAATPTVDFPARPTLFQIMLVDFCSSCHLEYQKIFLYYTYRQIWSQINVFFQIFYYRFCSIHSLQLKGILLFPTRLNFKCCHQVNVACTISHIWWSVF